MLDSREFIPLMTPTQALKSIQIMVEHSHDWYDETTTRERIKVRSDNIDAIQPSSKEAHLTKECPLKKDKEVEQSNPYRTHKIVCMIGNHVEIHKMKAQEDKRDKDVRWDITVKDVERLRVAKKANGNPVNNVKELSDIKTYDCETIIQKLLHQVSQSSYETGMTKREMKSHQRYRSSLSRLRPNAVTKSRMPSPDGSRRRRFMAAMPTLRFETIVLLGFVI
uniref:Uncharacterized protein n=1 Tax=Tanacetum cinerariifolium TaxID=118510 RepID=A0A6L2JC20_TANCI|nr:hypothetical protein [Tanacetum cinerariifolium]